MSQEWSSLDRATQLAIKAQIRPKTNHELKEYIKFFWGVSFPDKCHPDCEGKCTPPFQVFADAYFARYPLLILKASRGCLAADTFIPYSTRDPLGEQVTSKGGSIKRLYERFHNIKVKGRGKNRCNNYDHSFWIASCNETTGIITRNKVIDVIDNGFKQCFNVTTESGREISATANHPFLTAKGYIALENLKVDDYVFVHSQTRQTPKGRQKRKLRNYVFVKYHPIAGIKIVDRYSYHRLAKSRALVEASINGLSFTNYIKILNTSNKEYIDTLKFLSRDVDVHHIDENCQNDVLENLEVLTKEEHNKRHKNINLNALYFKATQEKIISIIPCGIIQVFDISMEAPLHNFVAEGFIVHNSGKSVLLGTLSLTEQVSLNAEVLILAGSQMQSRKVFEYVSQASTRFENMFWTCKNAPKALQNTKEELMESSRIVTGGFIKCVPASTTSVYGQRPLRLRIDECDVVDKDLIDGSLPCAHPVGDLKEQVVLSSTHYSPDGTLSHFIDRAKEANEKAGKIVIPIYQFCYKDMLNMHGDIPNPDGFLSLPQMERMKQMVSPEVWRRQFENGEPAVDNAVFNTEDIDFLFDEKLGVFEGAPGQECHADPEFINTNTIDCFYTGADWGVKIDWTVFSVFGSNVDPEGIDYLVYWHRPKRELGFKGMVQKYDEILKNYPGPAAHDATGMSQIVTELVEEPSHAINFSNRKLLEELMNKFISSVQERKIKMPKIAHLEKEVRFLTYEQCYGSKHMPDSVASLLMAWYARDRIMRNFNIETYRF